MDLDPVRHRVMQLIQERDSDLKNTSLAIGKNAAYLHQFVFRGTPKVLPEDVRQALAEQFDVEEKELRHKQAPPRKPRTAKRPPVNSSSPLDGITSIPEIDVRAAAGYGALNEEYVETLNHWYFPDPIIRHEFRSRPEDLRMITIDGDSMEPLLGSGDRIVLDSSQKIPVPPGIFVIWDGMGLVAKRVEHVPNTEPPRVVLRSVNPNYESYERDAEEVAVVGRVIWVSKRL